MRRLTLFIQDNSFSLTQLGFPDARTQRKGECRARLSNLANLDNFLSVLLEKRFVARIPRGRITKPMFVRVVRDRLNRERSFGKAVWQAAMAPMFGVDSILRLNSSTANRKDLRLL